MTLELTNDCNMACPHCPRHLAPVRAKSWEIGYMDVHLFKGIVDEISSYPWCFLRIVGAGEPAMHPHIKEILQYLADKNFKTEFTTNGTLLMRFPPEEILNLHIDMLGISIDGFDEVSYSRYRPGGDYKTLRAKVIELFNMRKTMAAEFPKIRIRNVIFPETTREQIRNFAENWLPFADIVTFNALVSKMSEPSMLLERCEDILFTIHVLWDGSVPLCGYQSWCDHIEWLGNLRDYSLRDLWWNERRLEVRKSHVFRDFTGIEFCRRCFATQRRKQILEIAKTQDRYKSPFLARIYRFGK